MVCEQWREILSAQLDGEASGSEIEAAEAHLTGCAGCRGWFESAASVTRRARTQLAPRVPDLVDTVLAAAPPPRPGRRHRITLGLRGVLGLLGAVQLVLGLAQIGREAVVTHAHTSGQHLWHESAAWNVAVGAGFLYVAARRSAPSGLLPMLSAFVATLVLLSVNDLITGQVAMTRLVSHGFLLVGWAVTLVLSRLGRRPGDTPPGQRRPDRSRWALPAEEPVAPALRLVPPGPYPTQARDRRAA
ncbi:MULTISPECIES: zf-HC2 domain-containing protein [unclassified Micromonospora]|uniref:zf-HC2 domain-containing protein n=1 Tax=unclassified Micromonospora TaxID=2617518 RepID=UPI001C218E19|nr:MULTISPECIES: zf-HC2 domain-containing protein [unclassified Micromonospora]MBU8860802.1 zf-HC2 domain-containing protein [Micromonospora sp. WMMB482]MDM4780343.1 zf-HC2 domain-containing protein [Micromonospora sp. b486]